MRKGTKKNQKRETEELEKGGGRIRKERRENQNSEEERIRKGRRKNQNKEEEAFEKGGGRITKGRRKNQKDGEEFEKPG